MNNALVFGSYVPGDSVMHRLDPRTKLLMCFAYVVLVFCVNSWATCLLMLVSLLAAIVASRVSPKLYWSGIKPLAWIIMITVAFQVLFSAGGKVYWHWGIMTVTHDGLISALIIFFRFMVIVTASTVLTATTPTLRVADALAWMMQPLKKIKVPVNQITLMISIALRFIPTIANEATKIANAQRSRGMNLDEGNIFKRLMRMIPILIPLFVDAFKRAEELATAMEARGYDPEAPRTHYRQLQWQTRDTWGMLALLVLAVIVIVLRFMI
ncbi:MAG: energy-coupling factor transporter transmembrane component T [Limosilactobacillus sp.]|uniref:energy-coupling factor transporter transmembrane component T family protein n=1 Tax=Limosilactobacillus sp. TaxID=2773925 RepID=UPI00270469D3|nr:energy-coupling factor transporter transmembrane component T [Limosilactobacillus sp.]